MPKDILERLSAPELDHMLRGELNKKDTDGELVRRIIGVLREQDKARLPKTAPNLEQAWEEFQARDQGRADRRKSAARGRITRAASLTAVLCLLLVCMVPLQARAETLWEKIARWTDSVFEFVGIRDADKPRPEYVFETDNPGLQEVYEAVVELGVTRPVVPMWLPEGYGLNKFEKSHSKAKNALYTTFSNNLDEIVYSVDVYSSEVWREYHKDEQDVIQYEVSGITYNIIQNNDFCVAVWTDGNVECSLSANCEAETLYEILKSITSLEEDSVKVSTGST